VIKLRGVVFVAEKNKGKKRNEGGREEHHLLGYKLNIMTDLSMNLNLLVILSIKITYYRIF
jgi:hypothetical protein